jgi:hypothetical protein
MKLNLLKSALVAVAGLALCAPLAINAQTPSTTTPAAAPSTKVKPANYQGTVKSIDTAANTLVVTTSKGDLTLALTTATKVKVDKKKAAITDITMGEKVTGSYTKDATGALTAYSVHGHTATAKAAKPATAPAAATTPSTP